MGERATCPVCGSYSSNVLNDLENRDPCRNCGCPANLLNEYQAILIRKEIFFNEKISHDLVEENEKLIIENMKLKTKIKKMQEILGWDFDSELLDSIKSLIQIVHDD